MPPYTLSQKLVWLTRVGRADQRGSGYRTCVKWIQQVQHRCWKEVPSRDYLMGMARAGGQWTVPSSLMKERVSLQVGCPWRWSEHRIKSPGRGDTQKMGCLGMFPDGEHSPKHGHRDSGRPPLLGRALARTMVFPTQEGLGWSRDGVSREYKEDIYCQDRKECGNRVSGSRQKAGYQYRD